MLSLLIYQMGSTIKDQSCMPIHKAIHRLTSLLCILWNLHQTLLIAMKLGWIYPSHKSQNAFVPYPTMQDFVTEMCTCVHISVTKWCNVGHLFGALWDLWDGSTILFEKTHISGLAQDCSISSAMGIPEYYTKPMHKRLDTIRNFPVWTDKSFEVFKVSYSLWQLFSQPNVNVFKPFLPTILEEKNGNGWWKCW